MKSVFIGFLSLCFASLAALTSCVSQTDADQRFQESSLLAAPVFTMTPSDPDKFSFAIVGDLHITNQATGRFSNILNSAVSKGNQFGVFLGDLTDNGAEADFTAYRDALSNVGWNGKALSVIGNHDVYRDGWENYKSALGPSHYVVDVGNSRFVALDTADGNVGKKQMEWLEDQLKSSGATHKFIVSHYLPIVPGVQSYLKLANQEESLELMHIAKKYGVRGWLGAHYHSHVQQEIAGTEYVVAGGGGGRRMDPIRRFFFVSVAIDGNSVSYQRHEVP